MRGRVMPAPYFFPGMTNVDTARSNWTEQNICPKFPNLPIRIRSEIFSLLSPSPMRRFIRSYVEVGSSATTQVTISNVGQGLLTVAGIALAPGSSPEFAITSAPTCPFSLPGVAADGTIATADVTVGFTPTAVGSASATLGIQSTGHPGITVGLTGNGVAAPPPGCDGLTR